MKCPFCSTLDSKVIDSRPANDGTSIRRRRECLQCHSRFTTYETVEMLPMVVIKKNGMRQSFDRSKLLSSMLRPAKSAPSPFPCWKRPQMTSSESCKMSSEARSPAPRSANWSWTSSRP